MNITNGIVQCAKKTVIFGPEGIGKTTLATKFQDPFFEDTEGGTLLYNVRRTKPESWEEILADVDEVTKNPDICNTLVIDTIDHGERYATDFICKKYNKPSIEAFGYGQGYTYLADEITRLLKALDKVIEVGINVVLIAHAKMRKFEQPDEMGAYDRWEMNLTRQVAPLVKQWCDLLLFCNYKTYVVQGENAMSKAKVQGGKRVMYTTHHPCWDAKNRFGLPDELPMEYASIAHIFEGTPAENQMKPIDKLHSLMEEANVTETEVQKVVAEKGKYSEDTPMSAYPENFISGWIIKYWPEILNIINNGNLERTKNNE